MASSLTELMNELNVKHYPDCWSNFFDKAMKEYSKLGNFFVDEQYILNLNKKYQLFDNQLENVLEAARKIQRHPAIMQYIWLLRYAMYDRTNFPSTIPHIILPVAPDGEDSMPYDFAPLFAFLPTVEDSVKSYREHQVPEDVMLETLKTYEIILNRFEEINGRPGYNTRYISWSQLFVDAKIIQVGRLQFEMRDSFPSDMKVFQNMKKEVRIFITEGKIHKSGMLYGAVGCKDDEGSFAADYIETDEYIEGYPIGENGLVIKKRERLLKSEWHEVLSKGDPVISVHIPAGGKLSHEICEDSYQRAKEILASCYPNFKFKAYMCYSWMMDPQLEDLLGKESKIVQFQSKYARFTTQSDGQAVFVFVFKKPVENYEQLPENTSLERKLKKHYLDGKYIYEMGGIFLA